jgi:hypothetical protein
MIVVVRKLKEIDRQLSRERVTGKVFTCYTPQKCSTENAQVLCFEVLYFEIVNLPLGWVSP